MIRLRQVEIDVESSLETLLKKCARKLNININEIKDYRIKKQSMDARHKPKLVYSYEIDVDVDNEESILSKVVSNDIFASPIEEYKFNLLGSKKMSNRPIVIGAGPAGLFCAYMLASSGYNPLVIERGEEVDSRVLSVDEFWKKGTLNINSNVQFGEGGAGTFSDGKLNTLVKDPEYRQKKVFEILVEAGAPSDILYLNKPHIGTDLLCNVVKNIRMKIISMGGEFRFNTCLTNIEIKNNLVRRIELNNKELMEADVLILAIGHSARDTFRMLYDKGIPMTSKSFAIGVRIQHSQNMINESQYGRNDSSLSSASYKLTYKAKNGRGVYTFCMCPGGYVVNSSSDFKKLTINGMSNHNRDSGNANSAVIVTVDKNDFGDDTLAGLTFQERLEMLAYKEGKGKIPIQLYQDFKENKISTKFGKVLPVFKGEYSFSNIKNILPEYVSCSLIEAIEYFNRKIKGYNRGDAIIAAVETRTSSPIKILRDDLLESDIKGIYPCGEGAGYAGGITSAAMDGIKIFEAIANIYSNK